MADLQLRLQGEDNASPALKSVADATRDLGQAQKGSTDANKEAAKAAAEYAKKIDELIDFTKDAGRALVKFTVDSVKAYMEQERATKQLALVAGELTGAFSAQAETLAKSNAVSSESVQGIQMMLLRFGEAPAKVERTTQAVLDFAAASGTDARTAIEALIRGVDSGSGRLKGMGVEFSATGDKAKDLESAVDALAAKFGGAGRTNATTLEGQVNLAKDAFEDVQKAFGGFIADVLNKTGALGLLTTELQNVARGMELMKGMSGRSAMSMLGQSGFLQSTVGIASGGLIPAAWFADGVAAGGRSTQANAALEMSGQLMQEQLQSRANAGALATGRNSNGEMYGPSAPRPEDIVAMAKAEAERKKKAQALRDALSKSRMDEGAYGPQTYSAWTSSTGMEGPATPTGDEWASMAKAKKEAAKDLADAHTKAMEDSLKAVRATAHKLAEEQKLFAKAGADMGAALANNLTSALEGLMGGGEQDIGKIIANVLAGLLTTAGGLLGNLLLPGLGGAVGSALGGLAGAGVRGLANAGPQVNINTFDARSTREFFEADGGRGLYNAQRTGRGQGW